MFTIKKIFQVHRDFFSKSFNKKFSIASIQINAEQNKKKFQINAVQNKIIFRLIQKKKKKQKAFSETSFPKAPRRTDKKFNSFQINAVQDKIIFQTYQKKKTKRHFQKLFSTELWGLAQENDNELEHVSKIL